MLDSARCRRLLDGHLNAWLGAITDAARPASARLRGEAVQRFVHLGFALCMRGLNLVLQYPCLLLHGILRLPVCRLELTTFEVLV